MSVTLKMIAERANVSSMAVSSVINGTGRTRVSAEKREKIIQIARELGYEANIAAQILAGGSSKIIGVHIDSQGPPTAFRILSSLQLIAGRAGYEIMISESHDRELGPKEAFQRFLRYGADGMISLAHSYPWNIEIQKNWLTEAKNIVFVGKPFDTGVPYVDIDWPSGIAQSVEHLVGIGCKRLGYVCVYNDFYDTQVRIQTFDDVCKSKSVFSRLFPCRLDTGMAEETDRIIRDFILPCNLDGILMLNDLYACFLLQKLSALKRPLAVVGHNNEPFSAGLNPPLTTIDERTTEIAEKAFELLSHLLNKQATSPVRVVTPQLIIRASTLQFAALNK